MFSRISTSILTLSTLLLLTACQEDVIAPTAATRTLYTIPLELWTTPTEQTQAAETATRTPGDPGYDDRLLPPSHVYIFACAQQKTSSKYIFEYNHCDLTPDDWEHNGATNEGSHYTAEGKVELSLPDFLTGRVYAVASEHPLTDAQVSAIFHTVAPAETDMTTEEFRCLEGLDSDPTTTLKEATLQVSDWSSADLRDLYSSPYSANSDYDNGKLSRTTEGKPIFAPVRLYHCAAKLDFTWEIATALQATTALASITAKDLPTTCKIFIPTDNPEDSGTSLVLGDAASAVNALTPANQWSGRAYAYVLQPPTGYISYQVTFGGGRSASNKTGNAPTSSIYTTWYRVTAEVK